MFLNPMLLSRALVIHDAMPLLLASLTHSMLPVMPPCRVGFTTMNCGFSVSSSVFFSSKEKCPMSSSSRATGTGDIRQSLAMSSHEFCGMGCSIECMSKRARSLSLSIASSGLNAPLASTRSCRVEGEKRERMNSSSRISSSQSIAPIFSFMHLKPAMSFSFTCCSISSYGAIHISPLVGMPTSERAKGVS